MYHVYVLFSKKDLKFYIGFTGNLEQRLKQHHNGEVASTLQRRPLELFYYETFQNKGDALRREQYFKTTKGKVTLRQMNKLYLERLNIKPT